MNRRDMRSELAFIMGVREGEADQDFQTSRLNKALQNAYRDVVKDGKTHGKIEGFLKTESLTWVADNLALVVPAQLEHKTFYDIKNVTSGEPGVDFKEGVDFFWADYKTMQYYGTTGPTADISLRMRYELSAEKLESDDSEPMLVPDENCDYIYWRAATDLRGIADDGVPQAWMLKLQEAQTNYIRYASRPRPTQGLDVATSTLLRDDESLDGFSVVIPDT